MSLQFAILGFLDLGPTTGYDLQRWFDRSIRSYWSATQSQVYRELKVLHGQGLVGLEEVPGRGKPNRKVYSLTEAGKQALDRWLAEPVEPQQLRHPFLLKLSFAGQAPREEVRQLFRTYQDGLEALGADLLLRRDTAQTLVHARSPQERTLWNLILENGLRWVRMETQWVEDSLTALGKF